MTWELVERGGLTFVTPSGWKDGGLVAAFTTRGGGVSARPYDSLNLGLHVGDNQEHVRANRLRAVSAFDIAPGQVVCAQQVHGNRVEVVDASQGGSGFSRYGEALPGCDVLVTAAPGVFLTMYFADCIPVFLVDRRKKAAGLVHSGWQGTVRRAATAALRTMTGVFGCRVEEIEAFVGPGIGPECYPVDEERYRRAAAEFTLDGGIFYPINGRFYAWDLKLTQRLMLEEAGVPARNISICSLCTACRNDLFFSYRAEGGNTGRMGAILGWRE